MKTSYQDNAMDFYNSIEQTLVNGEIPHKYITNKEDKFDKGKVWLWSSRSWLVLRQETQSWLSYVSG